MVTQSQKYLMNLYVLMEETTHIGAKKMDIKHKCKLIKHTLCKSKIFDFSDIQSKQIAKKLICINFSKINDNHLLRWQVWLQVIIKARESVLYTKERKDIMLDEILKTVFVDNTINLMEYLSGICKYLTKYPLKCSM